MPRAIIVAESQRRKQDPKEPIPAIDRFTGVYFRILKKYLREGKLLNTDILIVSQKWGILKAQDKVKYNKPTNTLDFKKSLKETQKNNLETLKNIFEKKNYDQIYVNVGAEFTKLIDGFEDLTSAKVIYARGPGLGPKAQHMKKYILSLTT